MIWETFYTSFYYPPDINVYDSDFKASDIKLSYADLSIYSLSELKLIISPFEQS